MNLPSRVESSRVEPREVEEQPRQASRQLPGEFVVVFSPSLPLSFSPSLTLPLSVSHSLSLLTAKCKLRGKGPLGALHSARHKVEQDKSARNGNRGRAVREGKRR